MCNLFINLNLTDMETGYKAFKTSALKSINLKEKSFSFEPEVTIKLAKKNYKFFEVPITYNGRSYEEGKKIGFKDLWRPEDGGKLIEVFNKKAEELILPNTKNYK